MPESGLDCLIHADFALHGCSGTWIATASSRPCGPTAIARSTREQFDYNPLLKTYIDIYIYICIYTFIYINIYTYVTSI